LVDVEDESLLGNSLPELFQNKTMSINNMTVAVLSRRNISMMQVSNRFGIIRRNKNQRKSI